MFKAGDKVVCIEAGFFSRLNEGDEYIVEGVIHNSGYEHYLVLEGNCTDLPYEDRGWDVSRFKLAEQ